MQAGSVLRTLICGTGMNDTVLLACLQGNEYLLWISVSFVLQTYEHIDASQAPKSAPHCSKSENKRKKFLYLLLHKPCDLIYRADGALDGRR